jgi:putative FmdB family regulatory protein
MPVYSFTCGECGHTYQTFMMSTDKAEPGCNKCGSRDNQKRKISKPQSPKMEGRKEWGYNKYTQETTFTPDNVNYVEYDHREREAKNKEIKKKIEGFGTGVAINKKSKKYKGPK